MSSGADPKVEDVLSNLLILRPKAFFGGSPQPFAHFSGPHERFRVRTRTVFLRMSYAVCSFFGSVHRLGFKILNCEPETRSRHGGGVAAGLTLYWAPWAKRAGAPTLPRAASPRSDPLMTRPAHIRPAHLNGATRAERARRYREGQRPRPGPGLPFQTLEENPPQSDSDWGRFLLTFDKRASTHYPWGASANLN